MWESALFERKKPHSDKTYQDVAHKVLIRVPSAYICRFEVTGCIHCPEFVQLNSTGCVMLGSEEADAKALSDRNPTLEAKATFR